MRVRHEIQYAARPRSVHAAEEQVAVQGGVKSVLLDYAVFHRVNSHGERRGAASKSAGQHLDFRHRDITTIGMQQPIQVVNFHGIEVDEPEMGDPHPRKGFGHDATDASRTDDSHAKSSQLRLSTLSPGGSRAIQFRPQRRRGPQFIVIRDC